jgi:hypothetical protein
MAEETVSKVRGALLASEHARGEMAGALKIVRDWHAQQSDEAIGQWNRGEYGAGARALLNIMRRDVMPHVEAALRGTP